MTTQLPFAIETFECDCEFEGRTPQPIECPTCHGSTEVTGVIGCRIFRRCQACGEEFSGAACEEM